MNKAMGGGGIDQHKLLTDLEKHLELSPSNTAIVLGTNYNTYKPWKSGRTPIPGPTVKLIQVFMVVAGTDTGKLWGI